jgi:hypothetical protein
MRPTRQLKIANPICCDNVEELQSQGHLLLLHWIADRGMLPLTDDEVYDDFLRLVPDKLKRIKSLTEDKYRLDLFEKI